MNNEISFLFVFAMTCFRIFLKVFIYASYHDIFSQNDSLVILYIRISQVGAQKNDLDSF